MAGDLHDIGKNLVGMMFESAGFEVLDLGVDVPIQTFIDTVDVYKRQVCYHKKVTKVGKLK